MPSFYYFISEAFKEKNNVNTLDGHTPKVTSLFDSRTGRKFAWRGRRDDERRWSSHGPRDTHVRAQRGQRGPFTPLAVAVSTVDAETCMGAHDADTTYPQRIISHFAMYGRLYFLYRSENDLDKPRRRWTRAKENLSLGRDKILKDLDGGADKKGLFTVGLEREYCLALARRRTLVALFHFHCIFIVHLSIKNIETLTDLIWDVKRVELGAPAAPGIYVTACNMFATLTNTEQNMRFVTSQTRSHHNIQQVFTQVNFQN
ncbi:hypothetical protein RRG08_021114 [Elysia crispata]|uniref:Uncharacterized protein n=1 Tax=Elysia crispata TaxID=231223 RepID=A0AAE1DAG1_9GAST|nr:hypothetical protein RRG08_021114 [Elysia crispata]